MSSVKAHIDAVLNQLRKNLGTGERPLGSNHNFITEWYNRNVSKIGNGPWCEMTITWAMWTAGAKVLKRGRAYTVFGAQDAVNHVNGSTWHWGVKGMKAGDQVYYNWGSGRGAHRTSIIDHTGMVERIVGDGTFYALEGNTSSNRLLRMRRDKTFVVGYTRFAWNRIAMAPVPPKPKPKPKKPSPTAHKVRDFQTLLELKADGKWDPAMDATASRMRNAARAKLGYPHKAKVPFSVARVQDVIDTHIDGDFQTKSLAALEVWVKKLQHLLGVSPDGVWGPKSDNAFLKFRKENYRNY